MAGEELQSALGGLAFSGMDNPYGIAASALGTATPGMISPYASTGQALGIGLGSILLQSLLGYQARQSALQDTLQTNTLANQMLNMQTPEERTSFIGGLDVSPQIGTRLSTLSTALQQQELARKVAQDAKLADLTTAAEFKLGGLGQKLEEQDLRKAALLAGIQGGQIPTQFADLFAAKPAADLSALDALGVAPELKDFIKTLPVKEQQEQIGKLIQNKAGQEGTPAAQAQKNAFNAVRNLEQTFRNLNMTAAELRAESAIPGSAADLAMSKLKGSLADLARVSGQTSQLSDLDLKQQLDSVLGPQLPFGMGGYSGSESIADRIKSKLEMTKQQSFEVGAGTAPDDTAKKAKAKQLRKEIDKLKALLAQRNQ